MWAVPHVLLRELIILGKKTDIANFRENEFCVFSYFPLGVITWINIS